MRITSKINTNQARKSKTSHMTPPINGKSGCSSFIMVWKLQKSLMLKLEIKNEIKYKAGVGGGLVRQRTKKKEIH